MNSYSMNAGNLGIGVVLLLAVASMQSGAFTIGDFALFASYLMWLTGLPRWVGWLLTRQKQADVSVERMTSMLQGAPRGALAAHRPLSYTGTPASMAAVSPDLDRARFETLEVRGLTYLHPNSGRGVRDVDLSLKRGSFVVITGRVGAGKTTLLRALLGLTERDAGDLRWNGEPIDDPAHFFVPPRCAYTPQAPRLFSETLRDNVLMGVASQDGELGDALRLAVLDGDVAAMERGLDTVVGTRGLRLSGGQIQRAATARMLVREPDLLVFDDVSSALDVETERRLWEGLLAHREATYLLVSNRRTALNHADEIVLLKDGAVEARGTLSELLRDSEEMRALWRDAGEEAAPDEALKILE
jgi:ATP-binding cassette subfamily B protein